MSKEAVENALKHFLSFEKPQVIALTGKWGVGKTYFWQDFIKRNEPLRKKYAYVSLFGINSLAELKSAVFLNAVNSDKIPWISWGSPFSKANKYGEFAVDAAYVYFVKKYIVCIDDIERRGKGLDLNDVFGFISNLNEQKKCRVIVIFNDDQLGDDLNVYIDKKEKVFYHAIKFAPTAIENIGLVFKGDDFKNRIAREKCENLNISNIRILMRIKQLIDEFIPFLEGDEELIKIVVASCVMLGWSYYGQGDGAAPFEYVKRFNYVRLSLGKKGEESEDDNRWKNKLNEYNWTEVDELDKEIIKLLENGYVDSGAVREILKDKKELFEKNKVAESLDKQLRIFHVGFGDDEQTLIDNFNKIVNENITRLSANNVDNIVWFFNAIEMGARAREIVDYWIENNIKQVLSKTDFSGNFDQWGILDPYLIEKCKKVIEENKKIPSLEDVLREVGKTDAINSPGGKEVLEKASEDDLYKAFHVEDKYIRNSIDRILEDRNEVLLEDRNEVLVEKIRNVLRKISKESRLNKARTKRYKPDEPTP